MSSIPTIKRGSEGINYLLKKNLTIGANGSSADIQSSVPIGTGNGEVDIGESTLQLVGNIWTIIFNLSTFWKDEEVLFDLTNALNYISSTAEIISVKQFIDINANGIYEGQGAYGAKAQDYINKTIYVDRIDTITGNSPAKVIITGVI